MDDLPLPEGNVPDINIYPELLPANMDPNNLLQALNACLQLLAGGGAISPEDVIAAPIDNANDLFFWIVAQTGINTLVLVQMIVSWVNGTGIHTHLPRAMRQRRGAQGGGRRRSKKKISKKKGSRKKRSRRRKSRKSRKSRKY